jgi:hypothetical protein
MLMQMKTAPYARRAGLIRFTVGLSAIVLIVGAASAQSVLAPAASAPEPRNPLALAASGAGVRQCLPALTALSEYGVRSASNSDVLLDWDHRRPNGAAVFSLLGLEGAGGSATMSIVAVPEPDGSCTAAAERIAVESKSCREVAQAELRNFHATQLLPQMTVYSTPQEPGSTVSLIPAAKGCLVIRRYVKYSAAWTSTGVAGPVK